MGPKRFGLLVSIGSHRIVNRARESDANDSANHSDFAIARCTTHMARTARTGNIIQVADSDGVTDRSDIGFKPVICSLGPSEIGFDLYNFVTLRI